MDGTSLGTYLVISFIVTQVHAGGKLELRLIRYENHNGTTENGTACDETQHTECDQYFKVCVDWANYSSSSMSDCDVGYIQTGFVNNSDIFDFGDIIGETWGNVPGETPNPIVLSFVSWDPAGIKVKVDVWDYDSHKDDDHVERLPPATVNTTPSINASIADVYQTELSGRTTLQVDVKVYCDDGFYGPRCDVFCEPHDDVTGHYTCGLDGWKQCHRGWEGFDCDTSVDDCAPNPCLNGGVCQDGHETYSCQCPPQYIGDICDVLVVTKADLGDHTISEENQEVATENTPSKTTGCVNNTMKSHSPGTTQKALGELEATTSTPTTEAGTPQPGSGNSCHTAPCQNGGRCESRGDRDYECHCPEGFAGATCQNKLPCFCQHGGSCVYTNNDVTCNCVGGWSGADCSISPCFTSPCQNMGHCVESTAGFSCTCEPGYTGDLCERDIDECLTHGCQHDSVCVDGVNSYTCSCPKGFRGNRCETAKDLEDKPYGLKFDGVMDREDLARARRVITNFVSKTESVDTEELSVQHQAGSCRTRNGSEVTIYEFKVVDAQGESLRVKDVDRLAAELEAWVFTGLECADPQAFISERKQNGSTDPEYLMTILIIVICCLCVVLVVLIAGLIYYNNKQYPTKADAVMIGDGSFKYREVTPVATTSRSDDRAPRNFRCYSGDVPKYRS